AIASGGFTFFADYLRDQLRLTAAVANELEIMDGKFTGHVIGDTAGQKGGAHTVEGQRVADLALGRQMMIKRARRAADARRPA
ncbi:hypothetical protein ONK20_26120, partial [Salmonella enterica subsp. enterica serovar Montevideo]|nr:hypothetical protein [Salmonella enterica subsp. enterica serovar Montevideo]